MELRSFLEKKNLNFVKNASQDALFPSRCPCCRKVEPWGKASSICRDCRKKLPFIGQDRCLVCGRKVAAEEELCRTCRERDHDFDQARALFMYSPEVGRMILSFKNKEEKETGICLGKEMAEAFRESLPLWRPSLLVPVPITRAKERKRGYNQAQVLAQELARSWDLPVVSGLLVRERESRQQKELTYTERLGNLREAFRLASTVKSGERIILVDDVITTGSTADVCAKLLKDAGASQVYVAAAAVSGV